MTNFVQPERQDKGTRRAKLQHICMQLATLGYHCQMDIDSSYMSVAESILKNYNQHRRLLADYRCPADQRIQDFLNAYLKRNGIETSINLPGKTFSLLQPGLACEMSLPLKEHHHRSPSQIDVRFPERKIKRHSERRQS